MVEEMSNGPQAGLGPAENRNPRAVKTPGKLRVDRVGYVGQDHKGFLG